MKPLQERANFSDTEIENSIKIPKWRNVNHYETLCLYCNENEDSFEDVTDEEFDACVELMEIHGQEDKSTDHYFFSIDAQ